MTWNLIIDDNFTRANTSLGTLGAPGTFNSPSTGGNWSDSNSQWQISSNTAKHNGASNTIANNGFVRPVAEAVLNSRVVVTQSGTLTPFPVPYLRWQQTTGECYGCYYDGTNLKIARLNTTAGSNTQLGFTAVGTVSITNTVIDFQAVSTDSTHTNLTAILYDASDLTTVLATCTVTGNTTANLQNAGVAGCGGFGIVSLSRIQTYIQTPAIAAGSLSRPPVFSSGSGGTEIVPAGKTQQRVSWGAATGGTSPYTYNLYRSTSNGFTPGAGNIVATGTSALNFLDTGLIAGTTYYYLVRAIDSLAATADSAQANFPTQSASSLMVGFIGDSITDLIPSGGSNPPANVPAQLGKLSSIRIINVCNTGYTGTTSTNWANSGSAYYTQAKQALNDCQSVYCHIMLGTNDSKDSVATSAATYKSNMQTLLTNLQTDCAGILKYAVSYSPAGVAGSLAGDFSATSNTRLQGYQSQIDALVGGLVSAGDKLAYTYFSTNTGELVDGIHPTAAGALTFATLWSWALERMIDGLTGGIIGHPGMLGFMRG